MPKINPLFTAGLMWSIEHGNKYWKIYANIILVEKHSNVYYR